MGVNTYHKDGAMRGLPAQPSHAGAGFNRKPSNVIAQLKLKRVGIQVSLDGKIGLVVLAHEMV